MIFLIAILFSLLFARCRGTGNSSFGLLSETPATIDNDGTHLGRPDIRQLQVPQDYDAGYYRSWSTWSWITTTDNRKFHVFACISSTSLTTARSWLSVYDYQTNKTTSNCINGPTVFNTKILKNEGPFFTFSSPSPDNYTVMNALSTLPDANFNLTFYTYGPNFYHAGSGRYQPILGGWTQQYTSPNMGIEGWLEIDGQQLTVDKKQSVAWYDRQIDKSIALGGWELFYIYLSNGVRIAAWHTTPLHGAESKRNIVTVWYPNGRHQVVDINNNTHASGGYRSNHTNVLYHSKWRLEIIDPPAVLKIRALKQDNEIVASANSSNPLNSLYEGACEGSGTFDGQAVTFYCNAEQYFGYTASGAA